MLSVVRRAPSSAASAAAAAAASSACVSSLAPASAAAASRAYATAARPSARRVSLAGSRSHSHSLLSSRVAASSLSAPTRGFASRRRHRGGGARDYDDDEADDDRLARDEEEEEEGSMTYDELMGGRDGAEDPYAYGDEELHEEFDEPPEFEPEDVAEEERAFGRSMRDAKRGGGRDMEEGEVLPRRGSKADQAKGKAAAKGKGGKKEVKLPDPSLGDPEQLLADVAALHPDEAAGMGSRLRDYVAAVQARRQAQLAASNADKPHAPTQREPVSTAPPPEGDFDNVRRVEDPSKERLAPDLIFSDPGPTPLVMRQFRGFRYLTRDQSPLARAMDASAAEDEDEEVQHEVPSYDEEYDARDHYREEKPWVRKPPPDEYISHRGETYKVGGEAMPPSHWRRHTWLTFQRSWDDLRKNGAEPGLEEIQRFIDYTLGKSRPRTEPINPPLEPRPIDFPQPADGKRVDTSLLKTEEEWTKWNIAQNKPRTWYVEARLQYRKKLHMTRVAYLEEYRRIKALHDANIRARWAQQMQNRAEKLAWKAARAQKQAVRNQGYYDMWRRRREKMRIKSRARRMDKEYKMRRTALHQFNFLLRERAQHWIQPKMSAEQAAGPTALAAQRVEHSPHLSTKLFEKQEFVVGFWPLPRDQDVRERAQERARREATKQ